MREKSGEGKVERSGDGEVWQGRGLARERSKRLERGRETGLDREGSGTGEVWKSLATQRSGEGEV